MPRPNHHPLGNTATKPTHQGLCVLHPPGQGLELLGAAALVACQHAHHIVQLWAAGKGATKS